MPLFTRNQLHDLLDTINNQTAMFVASSLGTEYLSDQEKESLRRQGVDVDNLYQDYNDPLFIAMQFGMISSVIPEKESKRMGYDKLKNYVKNNKHIPLNARENFSLESIKNQTFSDIQNRKGQIFQDLNSAVNDQVNQARADQEEFLRNEILDGLRNRETVNKIARELANKTGDYSRNFGRIVETVEHKAFTEGRMAIYERKGGKDANIWIQVFKGACKWCIQSYLTNGIGSKPKVFKLSELQAKSSTGNTNNATAVMPPKHPHCRCHVNYLEENEYWDDEKKEFVEGEYQRKVKRKSKMKITVGDKEYEV